MCADILKLAQDRDIINQQNIKKGYHDIIACAIKILFLLIDHVDDPKHGITLHLLIIFELLQ